MLSHPSSCPEQAQSPQNSCNDTQALGCPGKQEKLEPQPRDGRNEVEFKLSWKEVKIMRKFVLLGVLSLSLLLSQTGQRIQDSKH